MTHDPATCRDGDHYGQCGGVTRFGVIRTTGRPIMTMIAEAQACPRCRKVHNDPDCCDDGRGYGPYPFGGAS
jgi:hypothetical protein